MVLRNKNETAGSLANMLDVSLRTLGVDLALLKKIHALDRIGPDNGGEWAVLLKW
jgi:predicted HTH transcriptional regulator